MTVSVKISDELANEARRHAAVEQRSLPRQIEYWSRIGKVAEENPDLPYAFIRDMLLARMEADTIAYEFGPIRD